LKMKNPLRILKRIDANFKPNVPVSTAYTFILFGIIHFMVLGMNLADLQKVEEFSWGIFVFLGLNGTFQLEMTTLLMWFDGFLAFYGVFLLRKLAPEHKHDKKYDLPDKDSLK